MSEQDNGQVASLQRPTTDDKEDWKAYWKQQGQPWRTEPETDGERQKYLADRHAIVPDIKQGMYPFKEIKLNRADVEWLLATHESGRGPIDWSDEKQRDREGLDLRGANVSQVDLSGLPLARLRGATWLQAGQERDWAQKSAIYAEEASFEGTHLEGAHLFLGHLKEASFSEAHLEDADLGGAFLEGAFFVRAHLERSYLSGASLTGAYFMLAQMQAARLSGANLERTDFGGARLENADLSNAYLQGADLNNTHLEGADLSEAHLAGADLRGAFMSTSTVLNDVTLSYDQNSMTLLADIHWSDVNAAVVNWSTLSTLGDEFLARQTKSDGTKADEVYRTELYKTALRAYRQLAIVLRNQGLNEDAARFTYRSQLMQRKVFWYQRRFGQYLFSLFLDLLAGYGYRPIRSFIAYLLVITAFAAAYFIIGQHVGPQLSPLGSVVFSMTSFHGRGFFPGGIGLDDPLTVLAALEAFVGLLIEVTFIATLTQRLFGK